MITKLDKNAKRKARHYRMRRHIIGTPARPRLCVYRSLNHIYAQVIDDEAGITIAAASTVEADIRAKIEGKNKKEAAFIVGETVAKRAMDKSVSKVVYDRGGYLYTGRVEQLAAGARKAGLDF